MSEFNLKYLGGGWIPEGMEREEAEPVSPVYQRFLWTVFVHVASWWHAQISMAVLRQPNASVAQDKYVQCRIWTN